MVMEASPSPQSVGREFVRQYYTLLNQAPTHLHRFYNNYSSFVHGGLDAPNRETLPVVGQKQIHNRIQQLNFRDCHAKISQVDSQATLGNGVVVQVTGELSNGGAPMRRFTQTFVLAAQSPKKYYVHNDIFRYQDIVFSDDSGSGSARSEGEEEESRGYFPPSFPPAPPAPFPAPPPPPPARASSPPPAPVSVPPSAPPVSAVVSAPVSAPVSAVTAGQAALNGHPQGMPPRRVPIVASSLSSVEVEREPEPRPETPPAPEPEPEPETTIPEPEPVEEPAVPPAAPEPKTYANLLKSGGGSHAAPRQSPPHQSGGHTSSSTGAGSLEQRPRPQRAPRETHIPNAEGASLSAGTPGPTSIPGTRRYSDAQQLFLGNLPHSATEEALRALFARFGPVAELRVHSKPPPPAAAASASAPRHPNYGFITYEHEHSAQLCLNAAPLYFPADSADGVKLNVEEKKARGREPPRRRMPSAHRPPFRNNYRR